LVKLDEGLMITARLTDPGNPPVEISMPVEMVIHWCARMAVITA